ncbi:hypothetical protein CONPUDRAFT_163573 [Coniophora puteana RWD-64-598 SS2]|uniref:HMG box domain-containing protein n=1 Tax=Coniophora puteana (strain RWD-64-598) TaxID=741705 RepID=A0A5M3MZ63_CONPW|nr:uncharacterized protein CONPUDRAFT_163573 [Coniophora puteana RWD-64-598 SS2]EIW84438.1 hypothetical protein CONPUDRAFT_163573 [Coniophora puteana RWD-64-598 SS2]
MAATATVTRTKTATKAANQRTKKADKADKPKRPPSAYNLYVRAHMKPWLEQHQGSTNKDAMVAIGAMWRDAPENPNRGKAPAARKPKKSANAQGNKLGGGKDVAGTSSCVEQDDDLSLHQFDGSD